jgi:hypothetical protein
MSEKKVQRETSLEKCASRSSNALEIDSIRFGTRMLKVEYTYYCRRLHQ